MPKFFRNFQAVEEALRNFSEILLNLLNFARCSKFFGKILTKICDCRAVPKAVQRSALCRSRRELSNASFYAKFGKKSGFDIAGKEPCKVCPIERCNVLKPRQARCLPRLAGWRGGRFPASVAVSLAGGEGRMGWFPNLWTARSRLAKFRFFSANTSIVSVKSVCSNLQGLQD